MLALHAFGKIPDQHPFGAWHLDEALKASFAPDSAHLTAEFARSYYARTLPPGKRVFLDKTPRYHWISDWLYQTLPEAGFIVLRRNPLDVVASHKTTWGIDVRPQAILEGPGSNLLDVLLSREHLDGFSQRHGAGGRIISLQYEDLVGAPYKELSRLLVFMGLDNRGLRPSQLELDRDRLKPDGFGDKRILETQGAHSLSVGNWKSVLTEEELMFYSAWFDPQPQNLAPETAQLVAEVRTTLDKRIADGFRAPQQS